MYTPHLVSPEVRCSNTSRDIALMASLLGCINFFFMTGMQTMGCVWLSGQIIHSLTLP